MEFLEGVRTRSNGALRMLASDVLCGAGSGVRWMSDESAAATAWGHCKKCLWKNGSSSCKCGRRFGAPRWARHDAPSIFVKDPSKPHSSRSTRDPWSGPSARKVAWKGGRACTSELARLDAESAKAGESKRGFDMWREARRRVLTARELR